MVTTQLEAAEYLKAKDDVIGFLNAAIEDADPANVVNCLGIAVRSAGMRELERRTGVAREALAPALLDLREPSLAQFAAVLDTLGLQMQLVHKAA